MTYLPMFSLTLTFGVRVIQVNICIERFPNLGEMFSDMFRNRSEVLIFVVLPCRGRNVRTKTCGGGKVRCRVSVLGYANVFNCGTGASG